MPQHKHWDYVQTLKKKGYLVKIFYVIEQTSTKEWRYASWATNEKDESSTLLKEEKKTKIKGLIPLDELA